MPVAGGDKETRTNVYNPCHLAEHLIFRCSGYVCMGSRDASHSVSCVKPRSYTDADNSISDSYLILKENTNA